VAMARTIEPADQDKRIIAAVRSTLTSTQPDRLNQAA
jgi:hypothetical protein